jgi:Ca2+-binding EF-hand superfamily protein
MKRFLPLRLLLLGCFLVGLTALACLRAETPKPAQQVAEAMTANDVQDVVFFAESRPVLMRFHIHNNGKGFLAAWDAFIDELFQSLDADKDGFLSRAEAAKVPSPQLLFNVGGGDYSSPSLEALDANKDGKVSREELASYYRRNGGSPFQVQSGDRQTFVSGVVFLDAQQPASGDDLNEVLFKLLDTNKDGKLSREELAAAPEVLRKLDIDDDEMITREELAPGRGNPRQQVAFVRTYGQVQPSSSPNIWIKQPGSTNLDLARQLLTHYGPKDKPGNKKLTRKDLGLDEKTFAQLDADGDGILDQEELAHFAQRSPDIELRVRVGASKREEETVAMEPLKDRQSPLAAFLHKNKTGGVNLDVGSTRLEVRTDGNATRRTQKAELAQYYKAQFKAADRDNNGYLDKTEAEQHPVFRGLFALLDVKGEGKVYEKDVLAFLERIQDLRGKAVQATVTLSVSDLGKGLFDLIDADHDGRLSVRELRNAVKLLGSLDLDGDGCISRTEIPHSYQLTLAQGTSAGDYFPGRPVAVVASPYPGMQQPIPDRQKGPLWFRKMDRNRDGDVSRREFLGSDEDFARIDTDGDGLISAEEAEAADERLRKEKQTPP